MRRSLVTETDEKATAADFDMHPPDSPSEKRSLVQKAKSKGTKQQQLSNANPISSSSSSSTTTTTTTAPSSESLSLLGATSAMSTIPSASELEGPGGLLALLSSLPDPVANIVYTGPKYFHVDMKSVRFDHIQPLHTYTQTIRIQNLSARRRAIKVLAPATDLFQLEISSTQTEINPGLSLHCKVHFTAPALPELNTHVGDLEQERRRRDVEWSQSNWHDRLIILSGDADTEKFLVPLQASPPHAEISCQSFINFGSVSLAQTVAADQFYLENNGTQVGHFQFEFEKDVPLLATPAKGELQPGEKKWVKLELNTTELSVGDWRSLGRVYVDQARVLPPLLLDLHCNVV